jgi:glutathione synthase/RimK-type ligase-like ATP-grasp enzyme
MEKWEEAKTLSLTIAKKFRKIRYLGLDIACTTEGPTIIELNNRPDMEMIQDFYGGIRDDLKIKPKNWWYKSSFTINSI